MFKSSKLVNQNSKDQQSTPIDDSSLLIKGYITKLKSKKKRYFVLYTENENEPAHLDYYENEKKFRTSPNLYKRSILLKDCFAVIKKYDPRFKKNNIFVFAIYTKDDCFSLMFDNQEEMNCWFSFINEVHLKALAKNKNNTIQDYDKIWFAVIKDKKSVIKGSFYLCLTSEEIHLYKINNENNSKEKDKRLSSSSDKSLDQESNLSQQILTNNKIESINLSTSTELNNTSKDSIFKDDSSKCNDSMEILRFPFSLIRSFGHQSNNFIIDLGRSSDIGSCQLSFELKDCDTSKHIHSLVASTRQAAKNSEFRTRSNSENNRMLSRRNKSLSDKQSITHSKTTTSINQQQSNQLNSISADSKSSSSLKFAHHKSITSCDSNKLVNCTKTNDKESSTEHVPSPVAYSSVCYTLPSYNLPLRSRSTSESSTSHTNQFAQAKGLQNLSKAKQKLLNHSSTQSSESNLVSLTNHILSNESIQSIDSNDEKDSDYYMTTPNTIQPLPSTCSIKEEDYLVVDDISFEQQQSIISPTRTNRTFSNASTVKLNSTNKLDQLRSSDLKLVSTTSALAAKLTQQSSIENAQHYKQLHSQYSPVNSSFVELPDPVVEELNENDQIDEYIQVELEAKKPSNTSNQTNSNTNIIKQQSKTSVHQLEVISSEPSSISESSNNKTLNTTTSNTTTEQNFQQQQQQQQNLEEEEDYIGIESFSSTNTANNNQENFEASNLSPISSASCNTNRIKTFSISSSNNTSNNELNSLGTSPSLISNQFHNTTPVNHGAKEEIYKLEKVKSYFNSTEDCGDYIKPARTYSMGSRPQMANNNKFKYSHCSSMTKSKSNTINGCPTLASNQSLINHSSTIKVQCGHLNSNEPTCNHHLDDTVYSIDNRQRAYSMGSHSKAKKDMLLRKIRLNQLQRQENAIKKDDTIEDEETSEKCLSTPILVDKDYTRNRSATFTSFANSSTASTSSKKTNEDSSEEDDMMCIDLSKSAGFENEFNYSHNNQISIKEKFKELSLDSDEKEIAKD